LLYAFLKFAHLRWLKFEFPAPHVYGPARYIDAAKVVTSCVSAHNVIIDGLLLA
jgi:hypothetical protein